LKCPKPKRAPEAPEGLEGPESKMGGGFRAPS